MMGIVKPMLASSVKNIDKLNYPVFCTPKLDGIRCLIVNGEAVSRNLKPIRNKHVQKKLRGLPDGLDGELILRGSNKFNEVSSAIMRTEGDPDFIYAVFDFVVDKDMDYLNRVACLMQAFKVKPRHIELVLPNEMTDARDVRRYEKQCLKLGYEGIILRSGSGPYKYGRSTVREGWLLKLKRFADSEAEVIGFAEKMHNSNPKTKNKLGRSERSSHKAGLVPVNTLGKLIVRDVKTGIEFGIGTGFDDIMRKDIWKYRTTYLGALVKYKYQKEGQKEAPRFPVFLGFRDKDDT